jgi:hypothetical protein
VFWLYKVVISSHVRIVIFSQKSGLWMTYQVLREFFLHDSLKRLVSYDNTPEFPSETSIKKNNITLQEIILVIFCFWKWVEGIWLSPEVLNIWGTRLVDAYFPNHTMFVDIIFPNFCCFLCHFWSRIQIYYIFWPKISINGFSWKYGRLK